MFVPTSGAPGVWDRRRFLQSSLLALSASACAGLPSPGERRADLLIHNISVLPMTSETVLADRFVAVAKGAVVAIGPRDEAKTWAADRSVDGRGGYLMPALADMHVHVEGEPERDFPLYLANGVATVRNMSDRDYDHLRMRRDVEAGRLEGPRYLVSGPSLTGGMLRSTDEVDRLLERHKALAYDTVKIHGTLAPDVYDAVIKGAARRGLRVSGHVQQGRDLAVSLRMNSVEHAEEFSYVPGREVLADPVRADEAAKQVAQSGTYVCPTLAVFDAICAYVDEARFAELRSSSELAYLTAGTRQTWLDRSKNPYRARIATPRAVASIMRTMELLLDFTRRLHEAGTPMMLGTDAAGAMVPGFSVHKELELLVHAGLRPYEALKTATVNAAAFIDEKERWGTLELGRQADLILLEANPLSDISATRRVVGLSLRGRWYARSDLGALLERVRTRPDPAPSTYALPSPK